MTLSLQFTTMVVMAGSGIYLGVILDTFRRLLLPIQKKRVLVFKLEIMFWIFQAIILFYILFRVNAGELRIYIFLACLLGFSMYQALIKNIYLRVLDKILGIIISFIHFIFRLIDVLIIRPVGVILSILLTLVLFLIRIIFGILLFIGKILLSPLHFLGKLLKPYIPKKIIGFFHKIKGIYSTIKQTTKNWLKHMKFKRR